MSRSLDALLLYHHQLKSLDPTPNGDHHSVFKWILQNQPLDIGEYNWIFHPGDFISMVSPQRNRFENSIRHFLHSSNSSLKASNLSLSLIYPLLLQNQRKTDILIQNRVSSNQQVVCTKPKTPRWSSSLNLALAPSLALSLYSSLSQSSSSL